MCMTRIKVMANFMHSLDTRKGLHKENEAGKGRLVSEYEESVRSWEELNNNKIYFLPPSYPIPQAHPYLCNSQQYWLKVRSHNLGLQKVEGRNWWGKQEWDWCIHRITKEGRARLIQGMAGHNILTTQDTKVRDTSAHLVAKKSSVQIHPRIMPGGSTELVPHGSKGLTCAAILIV